MKEGQAWEARREGEERVGAMTVEDQKEGAHGGNKAPGAQACKPSWVMVKASLGGSSTGQPDNIQDTLLYLNFR